MIRFLDLPKKFYLHPARAWSVRKAMREFAKTHTICASCRKPRTPLNPVVPHHVIPFHENLGLAADPNNFIPLHHPKCHLIDGHAGDFKRSVPNVRSICVQRIIHS